MFPNMRKLTKEQMIDGIIRDIKDRATRLKRGTSQKKYLIEDLQSIESSVAELQQVMQSEQQEYWL